MPVRLAGELVRVVAVGGSVTSGMGAPRPEDAYLSLVVKWLRSLGDEAHPVRIEVCLPCGPSPVLCMHHLLCIGAQWVRRRIVVFLIFFNHLY